MLSVFYFSFIVVINSSLDMAGKLMILNVPRDSSSTRGLVGGYLLALPFLFVYKNILGSNFLYGIQERSQPQTLREIPRGYFPALLALNLCSIVIFSAPWVLDLILGNASLHAGFHAAEFTGVMLYMPGIIVLLMFTIGLRLSIQIRKKERTY